MRLSLPGHRRRVTAYPAAAAAVAADVAVAVAWPFELFIYNMYTTHACMCMWLNIWRRDANNVLSRPPLGKCIWLCVIAAQALDGRGGQFQFLKPP